MDDALSAERGLFLPAEEVIVVLLSFRLSSF